MGNYLKRSDLSQASVHLSPLGSDKAPEIVINGRFLTQQTYGVQRFAVEAVRAIDALLDADPYRGLRGRIEMIAPVDARDFSLKNIPLRRAGFFSGYIWEQIELPWHAAGRLLLNLCMLGPLLTKHQVLVVHDATVRALPDNFTSRFHAAYGFFIPRLCARADLVVTVSEFSRQEIGKWYGADIGKIPICYEGGEHINTVAADPAALDRFGLRGRSFFLCVGVTRSNKNIETVLAAFQRAGLEDALLVLTGKGSVSVHGPLADVQSDKVRKVGHVSDAELRTLYEHALALIYPSRYEGFGLPPLEAMNCGCPIIISDQAALVEIAGNAALRCGVDDVDGVARMMQALYADRALRERLKSAGLERSRHFTWHKTARNLLDYCLKTAVDRRR